MIDHATAGLYQEFPPQVIKILNPADWFLKVHWPKDPNVPGMLTN